MTEDESAAEAFARLDGRIALAMRVLEHIAAERMSIEVPDYSRTLEHIGQLLAEIGAAPALAITPEAMGQRIAEAAASARAEDRATIHQMKAEQRRALAAMDRIAGTARTGEEQRRRQRLWGAGGALAAALVMAAAPGIVARTLPERWHVPERMANRILRTPSLWDAGERLMQASDPEAWDGLTAAVAACKQGAIKTQRPSACPLRSRSSATRIRTAR